MDDDYEKVQKALDLIWDKAMKAKTASQKQWVLDQAFRILAGNPGYAMMINYYNNTNASVTGEWDRGETP